MGSIGESTPRAGPAKTFPPLARHPRYELLDVFRGIACLLVVAHHAGFALYFAADSKTGPLGLLKQAVAGFLWHCDLGVPLFFVISGYCIVASVDLNRRREAWSWSFLKRRFRRIYPPYWAAILWFVAVVALSDRFAGSHVLHKNPLVALELVDPGTLDLRQWIGNVTLSETWRPRIWNPHEQIFTRVAWSLCYEEQFYFVCFLILALAPRRIFLALAATTVVSALLGLAAIDSGAIDRLKGFFPYLWHEFAFGAAVYWRLNAANEIRGRQAVEIGLGVVSLVAFLYYRFSCAAAASFALALIVLRDFDDRAARSRWLNPFRACGKRCYSIYLAHLPACVLVNAWMFQKSDMSFWTRVFVMVPTSVSAGAAAGFVFFEAVERHFLNERSSVVPETGGSSGVGLEPT